MLKLRGVVILILTAACVFAAVAPSFAPVTFRYSPTATFVVSGISQEFRGSNNYRPNVSGDPYVDKGSITNYLSLTNVTLPTDPSRPFGNAERNMVSLPWFWPLDFVASKNFKLPIGSQTNLQIRIETFNLLNRTNLATLNANRSNANSGTITAAWDARRIQLGVEITV